MAGGFTSPAGWIGYSAAPASGGYITLPWWQAGGGVGQDPEVTTTKGGGTRETWKRREQLRKQLQEQYDREIERILANLVIEEEEVPVKGEPEAVQIERRVVMPDISRALPEVKREIAGQFKRELLIRRVERERAIRKLEEEMAALLVLAHLVD